MSRQLDSLLRSVAFGITILLGGCAIPKPPAAVTRDRAFITYSPPPQGAKGLRLAVKDLIDMKGVVTTAGSHSLAFSGRPAKSDAACLANARQRGITIVGKTNMSEFAVAVSGINTYYGTPRNPLRRSLIPGGSSSGSAVAVANHEADVALGTDTAGSIRVPAACCGVVGLKTTFGLVPVKGVLPVAPQLDTIGPLARDVAGAVEGMELLQPGFQARYRQAVASKPSGESIRIGRLYLDKTDPKIDRAVDNALKAAGFKVIKLSGEFGEAWNQAMTDGATVAAVGAWLHDKKYEADLLVTVRTKAVLAVGAVDDATIYQPALRRQAAWKKTLNKAFKDVDFIALPTMQRVPPHIPLFGGSFAYEARALALQNTQAVNFGGVPALAIPVPVSREDVPVTSLQLIGPRLSEANLLNAGRLVENAVRQNY